MAGSEPAGAPLAIPYQCQGPFPPLPGELAVHSREAKTLHHYSSENGHLEATFAKKHGLLTWAQGNQEQDGSLVPYPPRLHLHLSPLSHLLSSAAWCANLVTPQLPAYHVPLKAEGRETDHCLDPAVALEAGNRSFPSEENCL